MRPSIRVQVIIACLAVILPLAAAEVYFLLDLYRAARRDAVARARETAEGLAAATSAILTELRTGALAAAGEATLTGGDPRLVQRLLERLGRATNSRAYIAFFLPDGRAGASVPRDVVASDLNVADRPYFQRLRDGGEWELVNFSRCRVRGVAVWGMAAAVWAGGRFLGAVVLTVPSTDFGRLIPSRLPPGSWSIVDGQGQLVHLNGVAEIPGEKRDRSGAELVRRAMAGEAASSEEFAGPDGVPRLGASVPVHPFGWAVEVSHPVDSALAEARRQSLFEIAKYAPALAMALLIALVLAHRAGPPLQRLAAGANRIAQGDYTAAVELIGSPEVRQIGSAFNDMAAHLRWRQRWDEALKTIGQVATSGMSLDEIQQTSLQALIQASGATLGLIRLVDSQTKDLVVAAQRGVSAQFLELGSRIPWGVGVAGSVAATGQPRIMARPEDRPEVPHVSLLSGWAQSVVCVPLKVRGRTIGTLALGHHQADFFKAEDLPFLLSGASMLAGAILGEQLREATAKEAEEETLLFRELDHRVRNNLAALISLLHLGADRAEGRSAESFREMAERVERLADVHNLLAGREGRAIDLREMAEVVARNVLWAFSRDTDLQWKVVGDHVCIMPSQITATALILNELLMNCATHAFPGRAAGRIAIRIACQGEQVTLEVRDDGVGLRGRGQRPGLGLTIVETLATQNLRGLVRYADEEGTAVSIRFPRPDQRPNGATV
ncbi:MAG: GAF domain-containing protein [candidate division NC10 bacterium]|nr:GAF domain-containing protein [candidate division NC10 bacterium]